MNRIRDLVLKTLELFFGSYTEQTTLYNGNSHCYCGSNKKYFKCCKPMNDVNNKIAIKIIKKHLKKDKQITKIKVIKKGLLYIHGFKPGDINPLNRDRKYTKIDIGSD